MKKHYGTAWGSIGRYGSLKTMKEADHLGLLAGPADGGAAGLPTEVLQTGPHR